MTLKYYANIQPLNLSFMSKGGKVSPINKLLKQPSKVTRPYKASNNATISVR